MNILNLKKFFEQMVPELLDEKATFKTSNVTIPRGGRWEVWDAGQSSVMASTLAIFDAGGNLVRLQMRTRPRGKMEFINRANNLPVRTATPVAKEDIQVPAKVPPCLDPQLKKWIELAALKAVESQRPGPKRRKEASDKKQAVKLFGRPVMQPKKTIPLNTDLGLPTPWHKFVKDIGVSRTTAWRWRKVGFIETVNLAGKPYVTRSEIDRFNSRLAAGEFAELPLDSENQQN
jgi:hypothetical protein